MKTINVVAAIIKDNDRVFAVQRGYGAFKDFWEFPGGKIEENESKEDALKREILEELDTKIDIVEFLTTVEYDYPEFHLVMDCYICKIVEGELRLLEAEDSKWLTYDELKSVDWLPADLKVIDLIMNNKGE